MWGFRCFSLIIWHVVFYPLTSTYTWGLLYMVLSNQSPEPSSSTRYFLVSSRSVQVAVSFSLWVARLATPSLPPALTRPPPSTAASPAASQPPAPPSSHTAAWCQVDHGRMAMSSRKKMTSWSLWKGKIIRRGMRQFVSTSFLTSTRALSRASAKTLDQSGFFLSCVLWMDAFLSRGTVELFFLCSKRYMTSAK